MRGMCSQVTTATDPFHRANLAQQKIIINPLHPVRVNQTTTKAQATVLRVLSWQMLQPGSQHHSDHQPPQQHKYTELEHTAHRQ